MYSHLQYMQGQKPHLLSLFVKSKITVYGHVCPDTQFVQETSKKSVTKYYVMRRSACSGLRIKIGRVTAYSLTSGTGDLFADNTDRYTVQQTDTVLC